MRPKKEELLKTLRLSKSDPTLFVLEVDKKLPNDQVLSDPTITFEDKFPRAISILLIAINKYPAQKPTLSETLSKETEIVPLKDDVLKEKDYYRSIGVNHDATQDEIREKYRDEIKKTYPKLLDPASNLSEEEKSILTERLIDLNEAYDTLSKPSKRRIYDATYKTKSEVSRDTPLIATPIFLGPKTSVNKILITINSSTKIMPGRKAQAFSKQVDSAGYLPFTPAEIEEIKIRMKSKGVVNAPDIKEGEINTALQLFGKGVNGKNLEAKADMSSRLSHEQKQSLYRTALIMTFIEAANPGLTQELYESFGQPEIEISPTPEVYTPSPNQLSLGFQDGGFFPDILKAKAKEFIGGKLEPVKQRVKDFTLNAIKNGSDKVLKEVITVGKKALEKGAQKAVQAGVALMAKAGVTLSAELVAGFATGGAVWVATAILTAAKKIFGAVKRGLLAIGAFFTKEKDFRKQLFVLGGTATMIFLGLGQVGAAAASGAVTLGAGASLVTGRQIVGGMRGVYQSLGVFTTAVLLPSIAMPFLAAFFIVPFTVAIIVFIINSGAYVVPQGGFTYVPNVPRPEDIVCNDYKGRKYCFPVAPVDLVLATCAHHDYVATDINLNIRTRGTPVVVAFTDGEILFASSIDAKAGNAIALLGDDNYLYSYFHLASTQVKGGDRVTAGQQIGIQGSSGNAGGASITHFQAMHISFCPYPNDLGICSSTYIPTCIGTRTQCVQPWVDDFTCPSRIFNIVFGNSISCGPDTSNVGCGGPPPAATCYNRPQCGQEPFSP